jgi:hypothetical protein
VRYKRVGETIKYNAFLVFSEEAGDLLISGPGTAELNDLNDVFGLEIRRAAAWVLFFWGGLLGHINL